jgi:hypothetical protein
LWKKFGAKKKFTYNTLTLSGKSAKAELFFIIGGVIMRKMLLCAMVVGVLLAVAPPGAAEKSKPPIQLDVFAGFDYDSNVNLRSSDYDVRRFQPKGDAALYKHQAQVGYNLAINPKFSLLAQYTYYQDFHFRLTEYDNMSHNVTLSPTLNVFRNSGQIIAMCNFNYLTIGGNDYKVGWTFMPTYYQMLAQKVMFEIGASMNTVLTMLPLSQKMMTAPVVPWVLPPACFSSLMTPAPVISNCGTPRCGL